MLASDLVISDTKGDESGGLNGEEDFEDEDEMDYDEENAEAGGDL
jgi:hypothetical protein